MALFSRGASLLRLFVCLCVCVRERIRVRERERVALYFCLQCLSYIVKAIKIEIVLGAVSRQVGPWSTPMTDCLILVCVCVCVCVCVFILVKGGHFSCSSQLQNDG